MRPETRTAAFLAPVLLLLGALAAAVPASAAADCLGQPLTLPVGPSTPCTPEERKVWTPWVLRPVIQGMVNIRPLITHEFPLDRIADAFRTADTDATAIKVVVHS